MSETRTSEAMVLHTIDKALTVARAEAEKMDHIFLRYLLRLAHEETLEILQTSQDVTWKKQG